MLRLAVLRGSEVRVSLDVVALVLVLTVLRGAVLRGAVLRAVSLDVVALVLRSAAVLGRVGARVAGAPCCGRRGASTSSPRRRSFWTVLRSAVLRGVMLVALDVLVSFSFSSTLVSSGRSSI